MKNVIVSAAFFLMAFTAFSQAKVYTTLQKDIKIFPGKNFSIAKVIDARAEKENIGIIHIADNNTKYRIDLMKPLAEEFFTFFHKTFPTNTASNQIVMVVNYFEVGDSRTAGKKDSGFAKMNFDFYLENGDSTYFIYNYVKPLKEEGDQIPITHSSRIKKSLLLSVAKLDSLSFYIPGARLLADSLNNEPSFIASNLNQKESKTEDTKNPAARMVLLMGQAIFASETNMFGGSLSFLGRLGPTSKSLLGINLNYSIIKFKSPVSLKPNTEYKLFTTDFGLRYLRHIKSYVFFNSIAHGLVGRETITTYTQSTKNSNGLYSTSVTQNTMENLFLGLQVDNGLLFVHPQNKGIAAGVDFVLRFTNSNVFENDFGIKLTVGVAF